MYSRRNNQRDGLYINRSRSNSGFNFQNQFENQPMMGQGQILVKGPGGTVQFMAPQQTFFSNYNCNDIIYAGRELHALGLLKENVTIKVKGADKSYTLSSNDKKELVYGGDETKKEAFMKKMIDMQKATGGMAGETFNQLAGFGKPRFTLSELTQAIMLDFQSKVNGDLLRMGLDEFEVYRDRFIHTTMTNLVRKTKCTKELIVCVLYTLIERLQGDLGLGEYEPAFDGKRRLKYRRKSHADGRKRRRSRKSRSKKSKRRSRKSKSVDGKRRKSRKSRSRKSRSRKSKRSKRSKSKSRRRSKHMSAKKLLKLLRKL